MMRFCFVLACRLLLVWTPMALHLRKSSAAGSGWIRVLVRIDSIESGTIRLYVPQWNPDLQAHVSISALPSKLRSVVESGQWLLAQAQLKSDRPSGLRLRGFRPSPDADPDDGLA